MQERQGFSIVVSVRYRAGRKSRVMAILAFLLGCAVALSHMTATRAEGGVGAIDIALVGLVALCIGANLPKLVRGYAHRQDQATRDGIVDGPGALLALGTWMFVSVSLSLLVNLEGRYLVFSQIPQVYLPFCVSFGVILVIYMESRRDDLSALLCGFVLASFGIGLIYTVMIVGGLYQDRFSGFAENPNQTALFAFSMFTVSAMVLVKLLPGRGWMCQIGRANLALALFVGIATQSDALYICFALGAAGFGLALLLRMARVNAALPFVVAAAAIALALLVVAATPRIIDDTLPTVVNGLQYGDQDTDRVALWTNGLRAWLASPAFGNGPGAWSGIQGPFGETESHNSFIDWLSIAGIFGIGGFFSFAYIMRHFRLREKIGSSSLLVCLIVFSLFHFIFRSPMTWLSLAAIVLVAQGSSAGRRLTTANHYRGQPERLKSHPAPSSS